jgi:hypothetical protein
MLLGDRETRWYTLAIGTYGLLQHQGEVNEQRETMDRRTKKKIEVLGRKLTNLRQQLAGARRQTDEPQEVERLEAEVSRIEADLKRLKES